MSLSDSESEREHTRTPPSTASPSLQQRRLKLRHSLTNPARLFTESSPRTAAKTKVYDGVEDSEEGGDDVTSLSASDPKKLNRISTGSIFSTTSTLVEAPDRAHERRFSESSSRAVSPTGTPTRVQLPRSQTTPLLGRPTHDPDGQYIDYLERQLTELMSQLNSYTNSASTSSHAAKLRKLTAENRCLKNEVHDWETSYAVRVEEELKNRREKEKVKARELEARIEDVGENLRLKEVECEGLRNRLEELRGVEDENCRLEFRIETLSSLLADSTKTNAKEDGQERPASMPLPAGEGEKKDGNSSPKRNSFEGFKPAYEWTPGAGNGNGTSNDRMEEFARNDAADTSDTTAVESMHRRENFNFSIISPAIPESLVSTIRSRRMRRFPSGSSAPKTLILPNATVINPSSPTEASRPASSSSTLTTASHFRHFQRPSYQQANSLFSELARVQFEDTYTPTTADARTPTQSAHSTLRIRHARGESAPALANSAFANTDVSANLEDTIVHPTPLVVKVLAGVFDSVTSPTKTYLGVRRHAVDVIGRVMGRTAVSKRRTPHPRDRTRRLTAPQTPGNCATCNTQMHTRSFSAQSTSTVAPTPSRPYHSGTLAPPAVIRDARRGSNFSTNSSAAELLSASKALVDSRRNRAVDDGLESLWLWIRFLVAIVVALGVAVKDGPGVIVDDEEVDLVGREERERALRRLEGMNTSWEGPGSWIE